MAKPMDILTRFRECLPPDGRFICLQCVATQLAVTTDALSDCVVKPITWSGYSFAHAECGQCGQRMYCALAVRSTLV